MEAWFRELHPVLQALAAGGFTWVLTLLGAATVFLSREMPRALLDSMLARTLPPPPPLWASRS